MRGGLRRFLRLPRSPRRIRADVDEELRFEIEMRARDLMRQGLDAAAAHEQSVAEFGDLDATRRYCEEVDMETERTARRANLLSDLRSDAAIAWRAMRRAPAFAAVVFTTLALGIGANTTVFSVVRRVLIAPLPFREPDRLYRLYTTAPATTEIDDDKLSAVELADLATESRSLAGVTQFGNYGGVTYTDGQTAEPWATVAVAPNFFDVLGIRPALGRAFDDDDVARGTQPVVLISYALWERAFGGDAQVIGRKVELDNAAFTVVGVLPKTFVGPAFRTGGVFAPDALVPLNVPGLLRQRNNHGRMWRAVARLKTGVAPAAFESELALLRPREAARYPDLKNAGAIRPVPLHDAMVGPAGLILELVMAGALLVLVITCVNIAGLFLSRAAARRRELGVRAALGAGRGRLVRQVLTESLLYGIAGGVLGIALAMVMKGALLGIAGAVLPHVGEVDLDRSVLAFAAVVSIGCGLAVGLVPALAATRVDMRDALGDSGGRASSAGRSRIRGSAVLAAAQIAFAMVLLIGAGLLVRTFVTLVRRDVGYGTDDRMLTFHVNLPPARYTDAGARVAFLAGFVDRVRALPGVAGIGYTFVSPWNGGWMHVGFRIEGRQVDDNNVPSIAYATASDDFFSSLGVPLKAGRVFQPSDRVGSTPALVISESVARRFWPNASPIGARVRLDKGLPADSATVWEIVGVVGDVRPDVTSDIVPTLYVSEGQRAGYGGEFVVRGRGDANALLPALKLALHDLDASVPLTYARTLRTVLRDSIARQEVTMSLMGAFAVLALLLATLGVYSVVSNSVVARTREFGIRSALGARRETILMLVLRQGFATTVVGVVERTRACGARVPVRGDAARRRVGARCVDVRARSGGADGRGHRRMRVARARRHESPARRRVARRVAISARGSRAATCRSRCASSCTAPAIPRRRGRTRRRRSP